MNFVKTSTIVRTARRRTNGTELTQFAPPQPITSWSNEYVSLETAVSRLTAAQLPPTGFEDSYDMAYILAAYFTVDVVGVVSDTDLLVCHLAIWQRFQDRTNPPPILDSLAMQINGPLRDMEAPIREQLDGMLLRLSISGLTGDRRDLNLPVTTDPAHDPAGLLARADIQRIDGIAVRYD